MRKFILFISMLTLAACNYCPDIAVHPHENDYKLEFNVLMRSEQIPANSWKVNLLVRNRPDSSIKGFEFLQDIDYSKFDVLNITYRGSSQSRRIKGPAKFEVTINTKLKQVNCYTYIQYEDCYGGVSSGLSNHGLFVSVMVPKLPNNYELNSYGN